MYGGLHILRHGQEKEMNTRLDFPHLVQDVDTSTFEDETFSRPLWRRANAADGAGSFRLRGGPGSSSGCVTHEARKRFFCSCCPLSQVMTTHFLLILAVAVVVHSAAQAAAAMHRLVNGFRYPAGITVDPDSGGVSFEINRRCIIFSVFSGHPISFVKVKGLPPTFIEVQQAQQVLQYYSRKTNLQLLPHASRSPARAAIDDF
jgi:hypothetical protein